MALKATIYKADLHVSDLDKHYYQQHQLTLARHPSETDERLMVRLLAFALYADEALEFGKGIGADGEPALCRQDLTGNIELWIEIGLPEERRIRKACGRARQVVVILYGSDGAIEGWWAENRDELTQRKNLTILRLDEGVTEQLAALAARNMQLSCTIEDGQISLMNETATVTIEPKFLQQSN